MSKKRKRKGGQAPPPQPQREIPPDLLKRLEIEGRRTFAQHPGRDDFSRMASDEEAQRMGYTPGKTLIRFVQGFPGGRLLVVFVQPTDEMWEQYHRGDFDG